ncbi:MAG TPA: ATPase domain-containing protein, partial [Thermoplasmata archaeon]
MPRLSVGVEGFDAMIQGGLPVGSSVILQGPPGQEKLRFALTFIAEGLRVGASGLVVTSSQSPDAVLAELRNLGVNLDQVAHENRLRIVDWYSWSEESVQDVEERGAVVRSSIDLTNLGVALSRAITALPGDQPRRAVIELLSPATNVYELTQVYAFAQSAKRKFDRYQFTSLVLLEKEMHSASEVSTLHQPFDGVIEIERTRSGDRIVRKVGVLHLKDTSTDPTFRELEFTERGMRVVREAPKPATPLPSVPGTTLESQEERARRLQLIMQIASERLKLNPRDADALFAMAAAQATLDDVRGGLQTLERLADLNADYPGLWVLKTKLHARLGETDRARQSRLRAQQSQAPEPQTTGATVPCPMCEAPVGVDATSCANCGVKFAPSRNLEDELDELGQAAIQEMVEEELRHETKPAPEPAKRPVKPVPK